MTWTILILVVAVALYVFSGKLVKTDGKKPAPAAHFVKNGATLAAIILLIVGVNRIGVGTSHYLLEENPAILQEMVNNMQAKERERSSGMVKDYVKKHGDEMMKWAPVLGNENAAKTIYVWTAADCPYCRRVHEAFTEVLKSEKDVRIVIKNFPVHGEISDIPGRWTIAAKKQGNNKAAALYEKIMNNTYWSESNRGDMNVVTGNMKKWAKEVGLDVAKVEKYL